ncbi:MAG: HAMP domain-containing sensor histidine kinase [Bacteroidota bacterium]
MSKLKLSRVLLVAAILMIVAFQSYWLNRLYKEEWQALKKETNGIFRDVVYKMQVDRFKGDTLIYKQNSGDNLFVYNAVNALRKQNANLTKRTITTKGDSTLPPKTRAYFFNEHDSSRSGMPRRIEIRGDNTMPPELAQLLMSRQVSSVKLPPSMDTALLRRMSQAGMNVTVSFNSSQSDSLPVKSKTVSRPVMAVAATSMLLNQSHGGAVSTRKLDNPFAVTRNVKGEMIAPDKAIIRLITSGKALDDTLQVRKIDSIYQKELLKAGIPISFQIKKGKDDSLHRKDTINDNRFTTSPAIVGFIQPYWYQAGFENPTAFLLKRISLQILFSLFLIAFTSVTFIFLYRNLVAQRKLTEMKNDFISNITHELKTPLATVSVAVEALRNFGGIQNPERTKEYLDISASELQRLSLLVDKVLKLSLFENRELELKKETFDLKHLTEEVLNTMKLQFDTHHARIELEVQGNYFTVNADRLHITSVIFNLLDNALKYSNGKPEIIIRLQHQTDTLVLQMADNGIGISSDFRNKIFDKFFRVPNGDHHNIKGYGLGLSYVAHVIKRHNGTITVDSEPGKGSTFTIKLPVT